MDKQLLVNLKLDTEKAQQELNNFKNQNSGLELFNVDSATNAIKGISDKLSGLKETLVINAELDTENVTKQLQLVKKKLTEETGEDFKLKVSADLDIDAAAIKSAITDAFDTTGTMANLNIVQKGIDDLTASLANMSGSIEIDTSQIESAIERIDVLQSKLGNLSTSIGIDINETDGQEKQQQVFAATPKSSEQVRQVEQDAVSSPRTSLSSNYLENVKKDTRKANNQATRAASDTLEGYLKELVAHQQNLKNAGADADLATTITKLEASIKKVTKAFNKKGGDSEAVINAARENHTKSLDARIDNPGGFP